MTTQEKSTETFHKEEMRSRMLSDAKDRDKLRNKIVESIHPLDSKHHPAEGILNIVNGRISHDEVNVDTTLQIGEKLMRRYEFSWPNGFNSTSARRSKQCS